MKAASQKSAGSPGLLVRQVGAGMVRARPALFAMTAFRRVPGALRRELFEAVFESYQDLALDAGRDGRKKRPSVRGADRAWREIRHPVVRALQFLATDPASGFPPRRERRGYFLSTNWVATMPEFAEWWASNRSPTARSLARRRAKVIPYRKPKRHRGLSEALSPIRS